MTREDQPSYTPDELKSYLPSGWNLVADGETTWDEKKRRLTFRVMDNVDFDWPVTVSEKDVSRHGRMGALERAMDVVYRDRLGKGTRGFGFSG
jgi:hypothetical protein